MQQKALSCSAVAEVPGIVCSCGEMHRQEGPLGAIEGAARHAVQPGGHVSWGPWLLLVQPLLVWTKGHTVPGHLAVGQPCPDKMAV